MSSSTTKEKWKIGSQKIGSFWLTSQMTRTPSTPEHGEPPAHRTWPLPPMTSKESLSEKCHHNLEAVTTGRWSSASKARHSPTETSYQQAWTTKKANWDAFREAMDRKTAALELPETNISIGVALFNKAVLEGVKMFIPRGRRHDYQPYWTSELDNLHKALDQAREKMESSPTNANVEAYSKAKAQYTRARTQATRNSWHDKTASLNMEKDMTGLWNLTRTLNNDNPSKRKTVIEANNELITEKRAANVFADLYQKQNTTHVARERTKQVRQDTVNIILSSYGEDCSMTEPFSMKELKDALKKVKTRKAPGADGIIGEMLKHLGACSRALLLKIFNHRWMKGGSTCSLERGRYYTSPKERQRQEEPSQLPPHQSSKLCRQIAGEDGESATHKSSGEQQCVISNTNRLQGAPKHRGPTCLPCPEHQRCIPGEKEGSGSLLRSLKCIWQVWKEGLLVKLLRTGVRYKMYMWIQHFLFAKTTRVKLDGTLSKKVCLGEGVPQGGVLSPTLFLVYINDILTTITKTVSSTLHADDLAIWNASEHTTMAAYRIQEAINGINKWTLDWGLKINISNTNSTLFSLSTSKEQMKLRLKDEIVPQTDTPTFLGVKLDTRLTWKPQIEKI